MKTGVIIQGSSRKNGDTNLITKYLNKNNQFDLVDLNDYTIGHFDYEFRNSSDDFIPLMRELIQNYETIIFATPVYWYSMSGLLKVFFDRISDLLKTHKDLGRALRGKSMAMLSVNNSDQEVEGLNLAFIQSAEYLGMSYLGDVHTWVIDGSIPSSSKEKIDQFQNLLIN